MDRFAYLCPICGREMIKTGFCHLECPAGHYQEVCSDLFQPERVEPKSEPSGKSHKSETAQNKDTIVQHHES